MQFNNKRNI